MQRKETLICAAIERKCLLHLHYHQLARMIEPYIFGILTTGEYALSAYQVEGLSRSNLTATRWRTFLLSDIKNLLLSDQTFNLLQPDYNPHDKKFTEIIACV